MRISYLRFSRDNLATLMIPDEETLTLSFGQRILLLLGEPWDDRAKYLL
jgi:hypothetical protein